MHSFSLCGVLLLFGCLYYVHSKPVTEVLPHSRDYYAGYIKAITDNFDQLFANERKTRSTTDDEEEDTAAKQNTDESDEDSLKEVKRDVPEEASKAQNNATKKADVLSTAVKEKTEDEEAGDTDADDNTTNEVEKKSTTKATAKTDEIESDEEAGEENSDKKSDLQANEEEQEDEQQPEEEERNEDQDENETEDQNEDHEENDAMRKSYVLEHASAGAPLFPSILSGYQDGPQAEEASQNEVNGQYAVPYPGPPPNAFGPYMANMPLGTAPINGVARSKIKASNGKKKSGCGQGDAHHLQRVLMLPHCCDHHCCDHHDCCHHHDCCDHVNHHDCGCGCCDTHHCDCGHHGCHGLVHDVHHLPAGHPEYYSHDSPCLTYPHMNHVNYGYANGGCGCGCGQPYQSHHPVILHPTYQECHHHNVHVVGADCGHHDCCHQDCCHQDCCHQDCCHHGCECTHHHPCDVHHHVNHVHHVYDDCHHENAHHGNTHHGCDPEIVVLPHYGHTNAGHSGWNPYWGH